MNDPYSTQDKRKKEGKVTIEYDKKRRSGKKYDKDQGDYVDYEEVDE